MTMLLMMMMLKSTKLSTMGRRLQELQIHRRALPGDQFVNYYSTAHNRYQLKLSTKPEQEGSWSVSQTLSRKMLTVPKSWGWRKLNLRWYFLVKVCKYIEKAMSSYPGDIIYDEPGSKKFSWVFLLIKLRYWWKDWRAHSEKMKY